MKNKLAVFLQALKQEKGVVGEESQMFEKSPLPPTPFSHNKEGWELVSKEKNHTQWLVNTLKVELTMFKGTKPQEQLRKCEKYFLIN